MSPSISSYPPNTGSTKAMGNALKSYGRTLNDPHHQLSHAMAYHSVCLYRNGKNRASYVEDRGGVFLLLRKCPLVVESNRQHCHSPRCGGRTRREASCLFSSKMGKEPRNSLNMK
jgi:hypothetical protein